MNYRYGDKMETETTEKNFVLERTGLKNLSFKGKIIGEVSGHTAQNSGRWTDYTIYQTHGGKYIGQIEYITQWQGEQDTSEVFIAGSLRELSEKMIEDMDYIPDNLKIAFADAKYDICDTIE